MAIAAIHEFLRNLRTRQMSAIRLPGGRANAALGMRLRFYILVSGLYRE
jgi:hypothetical protein